MFSYPKRSEVKAFHFKNTVFDEKTNTATLSYSIDQELVFEEKITFHNAPKISASAQKQALDACLRLLHIACGVSYYKAYLPNEIRLDNTLLSKKEADFFNLFYTSGLGEFCYKNNVSLDVMFPYDTTMQTKQIPFALKKQIVLPIGGGKDSIVSLDVLKRMNKTPILFSVGLPRPIKETIDESGLKSIFVERTLSPDLFELNKISTSVGSLNGHVPVTGIIAFILAVAAVLYDFSDVALSNERSANVGNTFFDGKPINHQWSKSVEFERSFTALFASLLPDFHYFSLLRPLSEVQIARHFASCTQYHCLFTSCNRAFTLDTTKRLDRWCAQCDKCRFVFLILALFIPKEKLVSIFGLNPLNDSSQENGFKELLGLSAFKPFECVGEIQESVFAFAELKKRPEWQNDLLVKRIDVSKYEKNLPLFKSDIFKISADHFIPKEYQDALIFFK